MCCARVDEVSKKKGQLAPLWQPGHSGNPAGRPLGSRSKLSEKFLCDPHAHWEQHGTSVLERVSQERPDVFLRVMASVLPKELHFTGANVFDGVTDEELRAYIESLTPISRSHFATSGARAIRNCSRYHSSSIACRFVVSVPRRTSRIILPWLSSTERGRSASMTFRR